MNNPHIFELRQDWAYGQLTSPQLDQIPLIFDPAAENSFYQNWSPIEITLSEQSSDDAKPVPDFSQLPPDVFIFSQHAINTLGDLLTANGYLYQTTSKIGQFWAYRITTCLPALDEKKSTIRRSAFGTINLIKMLSFHPEQIIGVDIFQIPELPIRAFVSQEFATRVLKSDLQGISLHDTNQPY